uniref:Uncharacterized protein n=1 Tax=Fusarium clavum TaxID=2594811 RepID=A0A090N697_9HYPO|nr:unnamed protein product [Fusarium clavum]
MGQSTSKYPCKDNSHRVPSDLRWVCKKCYIIPTDNPMQKKRCERCFHERPQGTFAITPDRIQTRELIVRHRWKLTYKDSQGREVWKLDECY